MASLEIPWLQLLENLIRINGFSCIPQAFQISRSITSKDILFFKTMVMENELIQTPLFLSCLFQPFYNDAHKFLILAVSEALFQWKLLFTSNHVSDDLPLSS